VQGFTLITADTRGFFFQVLGHRYKVHLGSITSIENMPCKKERIYPIDIFSWLYICVQLLYVKNKLVVTQYCMMYTAEISE
jgi:hypothetical protein